MVLLFNKHNFGRKFLMSNSNSTSKNKNSKTKKDTNLLYILIFSVVIIVAIIFILSLKSCSNDTPNSNTSNNANKEVTTAGLISVISESGNKAATIKKKISNVRNVEFNKSHEAVDKYEKKQDDTLEGTYAKASDGYAYLTYKFDPQNAPMFFGTNVISSDVNSLLQYVFLNDKLSEIRIQYGVVGEAAYNSILSNINKQYGDATYSREFSNGNKECWWKTKTMTLTLYYQDNGVSVYLRKN